MEGQNLLKQGCVAPMFMCVFCVLFPMLPVPPIVSDFIVFVFLMKHLQEVCFVRNEKKNKTGASDILLKTTNYNSMHYWQI
jgi:hypothetical protein